MPALFDSLRILSYEHAALWAVLVGLLAIGLVGCGSDGDDNSSVREHQITEVTDLLTEAEKLAATPSTVVLADDGTLYVLDRPQYRVLALGPEGDVRTTFGREGEGPGEFQNPSVLAVANDTVHVVDTMLRRLHHFTTDGDFSHTTSLKDASMLWGVAFWPDGHLAVATNGFRSESLAWRVAPDGTIIDSLGTTVAPSINALNMTEVHQAISDGQIPGPLRNWTTPIPAPDGSLWLFLNTEAEVQLFDSEGTLQASYELDLPELDAIREHFFQRNMEFENPNRLYPLNYVRAGVFALDHLWLLLNTPPDAPTTIVGLSTEGDVAHRITLPDLSEAASIAIDADRSRLYLSLPNEARLVAANVDFGL